MLDLIASPSFSDAELQALFDYRMARIRAEMQRQDISMCVITSPISLRYAINANEYQIFQGHIPTCYLFLAVEDNATMHGAVSRTLPHVTDYQASDFITPFDGGFDLTCNSQTFVEHLKAFMQQHNLQNKGSKIAVERISPITLQALTETGFNVVDAECVLEQAKLIKHPTELKCIRHAIDVAQYGMRLMQEQLQAGITENQLWSILHQVNIAHGGDWIEGHMLASGERTNPWFQEVSHRVIQDGDLVGFDTDMIGPLGYMADISRTWRCGGGRGNAEQQAAYQHAYDEIHYNMELVKPGVSFKELCDQAFQRKPEYARNHYVCSFHGAGLCDEYPKIYYQEDWERAGYDGVVEENMVLCVESYSGAEGAKEGVKLEEMIRVTHDGYERLSSYPFEMDLLN